MAHSFDATLKEVVSGHAADFGPVFGLPTHLPTKVLTNDLSTLTAATDVAFGYGDPLEQVADLNFQSGPDAWVDVRMWLYNGALHHKYRVKVRSLLILLCPAANLTRLNGRYAYTLGGTGVEFTYEAIRLWEQPVEPFLHGGVGLLPLAPLCRLPTDELQEVALRRVVEEMDDRLVRELPRPAAARLMTAAFILTGLVMERDRLNVVYDGVRVMHESSAYGIIIDQGQLKHGRRVVLRQGQKRLGPPPEGTEAVLETVVDLDRLDRLIDAIPTVASWAELLAMP